MSHILGGNAINFNNLISNLYFTILLSRTIVCNSQNKKRHIVKFFATTNTKTKAFSTTLQNNSVIIFL
ncbi:hypothetical protein X975_20624, partial [Stegodyphus mimosarum]